MESEPIITTPEKLFLAVWVVILTVGSLMAIRDHYEIKRIASGQEVRR
jgi:hypothetical protein